MNLKYLKLVILLVAITSFATVFGANGLLRRADVSFLGGVSQPIGAFSQPSFSNINSTQNSFDFNGAQLKSCFGLNLNFYVINDYVGVSMLFNFNTFGSKLNLFDNKALVNIGAEWQPKFVDNWKQFSALIGMSFRYPIVPRVLITARTLIGYGHLLSPYYLAETQPNRTIKYSNVIFSDNASAFAFDAGVGLKFVLFNGGMHFNLNVDYMGATNFKFKLLSEASLVPSTEETPTVLTSTTYNVFQKFGALNYSAGISFCF